ncbi:hypothetical protein FGM00_16830 [Aggregatimonas sangjinii]|uniref:Putative zinc-finger domain-containing protein n=1 Tax=Aggregatimonas sangjinii TaxID=2583587 RepID=A0A5B7SSP4_9FLAO|nr:HEAT repeat domain-containing protein [Aggregatimonas sangjinii]QCX01696.1 hypothetical protein FGM00_16830 [Aggregatimonas sangjinii]
MQKNDHISEMLPDYLDGVLKPGEMRAIAAHLSDCESCSKELEDIKQLFQAIESETVETPSAALRTNFLEQLEEEKKSLSKIDSSSSEETFAKNLWPNGLLKIAAGIALLIGAFLLGRQQTQQTANSEIALLNEEKSEFKQTAMLSLMENKSASRRIQGVNYVAESKTPDEAIIRALTDRLHYDDNVNVRAAAVGVLINFTSSTIVTKAFIAALSTESDPGIQIEIIQFLGKIQEKKAVAPMRELMEKEDTQPFVKKQIASVLPNII